MSIPQKPIDLSKLLGLIQTLATTSPETAKALLKEFEAYSAHLREMDRTALRAQIVVTYLGQVFGLLIGMTAIISGSLTIYHGNGWPGAFIGGGGVIGLVSVFVLGRKKPS